MTTVSTIETTFALISETTSIFSDTTGNESLDSFNTSDTNVTMATLATTTKSPYGKFGLLESFTIFWVTLGINEYYLYVIIALGFPGNIASFITILRMPPITSTSMYVATLAMTDNMALIIKILVNLLLLYYVNLYDAGCKLMLYAGNFAVIYANWVLVAMTVERFFAIWFPFKMTTISTKKNAGIVLGVLAIATALFSSWYLIVIHSVYVNNRGWRCYTYPEYLYFSNEYWSLLYALAQSFTPSAILILLNVLIVVGLQRSTRVQKEMANNKSEQMTEKIRQQRQITIMLTTISIAFVVLNLPNCIFFIIKPHWHVVRRTYEHAVFLFTYQFIHLLSDLTHAVNFYLYFLSARKFRTRFLDMLRCGKTKDRGMTTASATGQTNMAMSNSEVSAVTSFNKNLSGANESEDNK